MSSNPEINQMVSSMRQAMISRRLAHAYLLSGRSRALLVETAGEIIALLYCSAPDQTRPCLACTACRQALEHRHPDLIWIEPESKSRRILTEQIDRLRRHMSLTTFDGGWKTVVLMDADRLNEESSNKILKILEEPAPGSLFLLLTVVPDEILPTITSRCQRLMLSGYDPEAGREDRALILEAMIRDAEPGMIAAISRARFILSRLKEAKSEISETEYAALDSSDMEDMDSAARKKIEAMVEARIESRYRGRRESLLASLLLWQRDLLLCLCGSDDALLAFKDDAATVRNAARGMTIPQAISAQRIVEDMQDQLTRNIYEGMVFDNGFMRLAGKSLHPRPTSGESVGSRET